MGWLGKPEAGEHVCSVPAKLSVNSVPCLFSSEELRLFLGVRSCRGRCFGFAWTGRWEDGAAGSIPLTGEAVGYLSLLGTGHEPPCTSLLIALMASVACDAAACCFLTPSISSTAERS